MEGVVMGCREPHRGVVGQWRGLARSGLVQTGQAGRHFDMLGFAVGGPAGCDVVTELSQAARNMVGRRQMH